MPPSSGKQGGKRCGLSGSLLALGKQDIVLWANAQEFGGYRDWKINEEKYVTGRPSFSGDNPTIYYPENTIINALYVVTGNRMVVMVTGTKGGSDFNAGIGGIFEGNKKY